jgi:hypothetical protein
MTKLRQKVVYCLTCGKPVPQLYNSRPPKLVCRSGSFRPSGVERPSPCAVARFDHGKRLAAQRRYRESHLEKVRGYFTTDTYRERRRVLDRLSRKLNPEAWRERYRRQEVRRREREGRRRLILGYRQNGQDLLTQVRTAVPNHYDRATRDEMVGEAVMLALEGATITDAVKAAVKTVNKVEAPGRYAKPIEDCFWL